MDYYNILGLKENPSKEEIQRAYENQVRKIKTEIPNQRRAEKFLKLFREAYDALIREADLRELEQYQTMIVDRNELREAIDEDKTIIIDKRIMQEELAKHTYIVKEIYATENLTEEDITEYIPKDKYEEHREVDIDDEVEEYIPKRNVVKEKVIEYKEKASSSKKRPKRKSNSLINSKKDKNREPSKEINKDKETKVKTKVVKKSNGSNTKSVLNLIMIPVKIILLPIIWIISGVIFLCKVINMVSWIASKIMIVGSIGLVAIHFYQIHLGAQEDIKFLIVAGVVAVASFFLPYILRVVPKFLEKINTILKNIVF